MENRGVYVALLPPAAPDPGLVAAVAKVVGKTPAATKLLLGGRIPRIVGVFMDPAQAKSAVEGLKLLGLKASTLNAEELHASDIFAARSAVFGDLRVQFLDRRGESMTVESAAATLVIQGTVESRQEVERTTTKTKLNLPATLLTGGIPIRRKTTEKTVEVSTTTEAFVRIYGPESVQRCVQIRQHEFDYSCLGSEMGPVSLTNFSKLVVKIKLAFSHAAYDDRLTKAFTVDLPSATAWEKADIACKLIFMFMDL